MADAPSLFSRLFGQRPTAVAPSPEPTPPAAAERPATLSLVIPPDHITLTLLRAHVRKWDWMARSQDSLRVASGNMSLFDFALAQRQRNARQRLIERADRGEPITETDLIDVMGADFNLNATEVAMILDADRDLRRTQERADDRARWQRAVDAHEQGGQASRHGGQGGKDNGDGNGRRPGSPSPTPPAGPVQSGEPPFDARLRADDVGTLIFAAAGTDDTASLTEWLDDDAAGLLRSLRADATLAHAEARGEVVYEATVCAWARTMVHGGRVVRADLPSAVLRWLGDDEALRAAGGDQDALEAYFTDATRESAALHRAAWIDAVTSTDGRAAAAALPAIKGVTTAANVGAPAMRAGEFKRLDASEAAASVYQVFRSRRTGESNRVRSTDAMVDSEGARRVAAEEITGDDTLDRSRDTNGETDSVGPAFDEAPIDEGFVDEAFMDGGLDLPSSDAMLATDTDSAHPTTPKAPSAPRIAFDSDALWSELAPPAPRVAPSFSSPVPPKAETGAERVRSDTENELSALPQSADDAPGPAVWIRGRRVDGVFVRVQDDLVSIVVDGKERTIPGPIDRGNGPAVIEPDGTKRYYVRGALSRPDGPAIEADDPAHDVYAIDGAVKPLDLPPTLLRDRAFRARLFRAWERAGFPISPDVQARALLAIMPPEERESFLAPLRASGDAHDLQFAAGADALYGPPTAAASPVAPTLPVPPLPASMDLHDDFEDFYDSLISDHPTPG